MFNDFGTAFGPDFWKHHTELAVRDFLEDHEEEYENDPLILDGQLYYDEAHRLWTQKVHNSKGEYVIVDLDGVTVLRPYPLAFYPFNCPQQIQ